MHEILLPTPSKPLERVVTAKEVETPTITRTSNKSPIRTDIRTHHLARVRRQVPDQVPLVRGPYTDIRIESRRDQEQAGSGECSVGRCAEDVRLGLGGLRLDLDWVGGVGRRVHIDIAIPGSVCCRLAVCLDLGKRGDRCKSALAGCSKKFDVGDRGFVGGDDVLRAQGAEVPDTDSVVA